MKITATILKTSPRYQDWMDSFGTDTVPILSQEPVYNTAPGIPERVAFYLLDHSQLTEEQLQKVTELLSKKFSLPESEIIKDMAKYGLPILAEDVVISFEPDLEMMI